MRDKEEWYIHEAPRIVTDDVWDEVNAIIQEQEKEKSTAIEQEGTSLHQLPYSVNVEAECMCLQVIQNTPVKSVNEKSTLKISKPSSKNNLPNSLFQKKRSTVILTEHILSFETRNKRLKILEIKNRHTRSKNPKTL